MRHQGKAGALLTGDEYEATDSHFEDVSTVAASGSTETLDVSTAGVHDVTLTDDCTFTFTGATSGHADSMVLLLRQDGSGGHAVTWPGTVEWQSDIEPSLSTAANAVATLIFWTVDGGTTWFGALTGPGFVQGSEFPVSPSTSDVFYHTTYGELFQYDGTRWLGEQRESYMATFTAGVSSDAAQAYYPVHATDGIWLDEFVTTTFVATTNNGSNFWELELDRVDSSNTATNIAIATTNADTASTWTRHVVSIGAVLNATARVLLVRADETGNAGNLIYAAAIRWRRIGV